LLAALVLILLAKVMEIRPVGVELDRRIDDLENQIEKTEELSAQLEKNADYYKSDEYKEEQARIKLNYKKPGEEVILIYESSEEGDKPEKVIDLPNWKKWLEYLFE